MKKNLQKLAATVAVASALGACSTTTNFTSAQPDTKVTVKTNTSNAAPRTETMKATSFGNYEFRVEKEGSEPMYGILPLKFNGGYLAADILFFAPGLFFNLREPYPFYEFDAEKKVVRYKKNASDSWTDFVPPQIESDRAKQHFQATGQ